VCIWNSDLQLLREFQVGKYIGELQALQKDVLLVHTFELEKSDRESSISLYNCTSGELLQQISVSFPMQSLFLTPDKEFLVMVGERKISFYHVNGAYVYSEFETTQPHIFQSARVKVWRNCTFTRKMNFNRSVLAVDFEK